MANKKLIYSADFKKTLHEKIKQYAHGSPQRNMLYAVLQWLDKEPRIDAEPVRHGRWDKVQVWKDNPHTTLKCSACKTWQPIYEHDNWDYCPFCGAKMDGKECVPRKCGTCSNDGWDMPQCRECNEENGLKWYKRKMDAEVK